MKVQQLQNAVEAFDFDIFSDEHIPELGRLLSDKQVVVVKQRLTQERHFGILDSWGSSCYESYYLWYWRRQTKGFALECN